MARRGDPVPAMTLAWHLEARIGALLPPPEDEVGGRPGKTVPREVRLLPRNRTLEFRLIHRYRHVWEADPGRPRRQLERDGAVFARLEAILAIAGQLPDAGGKRSTSDDLSLQVADFGITYDTAARWKRWAQCLRPCAMRYAKILAYRPRNGGLSWRGQTAATRYLVGLG